LVQLLKKKDCVIHATAGNENKLEFLRKCGIHSVINYRESDFKKIIRQKVPQGLDAAFDSLGGKTTRQTRTLLGPGGRLVCFGVAQLATSKNQILKTWNALKTITEFGLISPLSLLTRSQGIIGINMLRIADEKPQLLSRCLEKVVELAIQGEVQPHVDRVFHASEIAKAHEWVAKRNSIGKVVLSWDSSLIA
jgi:NADPH2:quinone reductase